MAKSSLPSPDEALAGMAKVGAPRKPMGKDALKFTNASATGTGKTTLVPKKNTAAGDPTAAGTKASRSAGMASETTGAAYKIAAHIYKPNDPAAGSVQANGRIISNKKGDRSNYESGNSASY